MHAVYTMPGVADMGMVWMGASSTSQDLSMGLVANDSGDLMLDHDNPYFTPSHNSASNQSLEDIGAVHDSPMVKTINFFLLLLQVFLFRKWKEWIYCLIQILNKKAVMVVT